MARRVSGKWVVAGLVLGSAGIAFGIGWTARSPAVPLLARVPATATLVATVDVRALAATPLVRGWLEGSGPAGRMRAIEALCGTHPLKALEALAVFALPSEGRTLGRVGLVARGSFDRHELSACVERVVTEGGGGIRAIDLGGVAGLASVSGSSRLAFVTADTLAGGDEATVEAVISVHRRDTPSAEAGTPYAALWKQASSHHPVVIVGRVPESWRAALGGWLADSGRDDDGGDGAGAGLPEAFALTVSVTDLARLELHLPGRARATAGALAAAIGARLAALRASPLATLSPVAPLLRSMTAAAHDADVKVTAELTRGELEFLGELLLPAALGDGRAASDVLERALRSTGASPAPGQPDAPPPPEAPTRDAPAPGRTAPPAVVPDETLRPTEEGARPQPAARP